MVECFGRYRKVQEALAAARAMLQDRDQGIRQLAEEENHHPDLHLVGYRNLAIELWTHAIDGLTEIDRFEITVNNWDPTARKFKFIGSEPDDYMTSGDAETRLYRLFQPCEKTVDIRLGYADNLVTMMLGNFTMMEPRFPANAHARDVYEYDYEPQVDPAQWGRWFALTFQAAQPGDWVVAAVPILPPSAAGELRVLLDGADVSGAPKPNHSALLAAHQSAWWYDAPGARMWLRIELDALPGGGSTVFDGASRTFEILSW